MENRMAAIRRGVMALLMIRMTMIQIDKVISQITIQMTTLIISLMPAKTKTRKAVNLVSCVAAVVVKRIEREEIAQTGKMEMLKLCLMDKLLTRKSNLSIKRLL